MTVVFFYDRWCNAQQSLYVFFCVLVCACAKWLDKGYKSDSFNNSPAKILSARGPLDSKVKRQVLPLGHSGWPYMTRILVEVSEWQTQDVLWSCWESLQDAPCSWVRWDSDSSPRRCKEGAVAPHLELTQTHWHWDSQTHGRGSLAHWWRSGKESLQSARSNPKCFA